MLSERVVTSGVKLRYVDTNFTSWTLAVDFLPGITMMRTSRPLPRLALPLCKPSENISRIRIPCWLWNLDVGWLVSQDGFWQRLLAKRSAAATPGCISMLGYSTA